MKRYPAKNFISYTQPAVCAQRTEDTKGTLDAQELHIPF